VAGGISPEFCSDRFLASLGMTFYTGKKVKNRRGMLRTFFLKNHFACRADFPNNTL
jgi:hypothetical protein